MTSTYDRIKYAYRTYVSYMRSPLGFVHVQPLSYQLMSADKYTYIATIS